MKSPEIISLTEIRAALEASGVECTPEQLSAIAELVDEAGGVEDAQDSLEAVA